MPIDCFGEGVNGPVGRVAERASKARTERPKFFAYMATLMLLLVFVAFFKSFYFREFSSVAGRLGQRELPLCLIAHGCILTGWYSLFCVQAWLGAQRRVQTYRKLGVVALGVAAAEFGRELGLHFLAVLGGYFVATAITKGE